MLVLGTLLLSALASVTPAMAAHGEPLASTYEQAACDPSEGGECAQEVDLFDLALAAAPVLDCDNVRVQELIGSCDLVRSSPLAPHAPSLHNAGRSGWRGAHAWKTQPEHTPPPRSDDLQTLPSLARPLLLPPDGRPIAVALRIHRADGARDRLDRPPRV